MRLTRMTRVVPAGAVAAMTVCAALASAGSASATTLNGDWAPFTRCPVDDPGMLAADGNTTVAACAAADSPSGSIKLGNSTTPTGDANLQFGVIQDNSTSPSTDAVVSPAGGALVTAPATVPGGVLGLMCPSQVPVVAALCNEAANSDLNTVTATVEAAGQPSNFNLVAQFLIGQPIITLPVKIHLHNPLLGSSCYIGSDSDPIVLHPANLAQPTFGNGEQFDANGTPDPNGVLQSTVLIGNQGDSTFAVPGASGCGGLTSLLVDPAINLKLGLPSPSGNNNLVLANTTSQLATFSDPPAFAPNEGQDLSADWHSAVQ
jgi:hypothetical protein